MPSGPKISAVLITREAAWPSDAEPKFPFDEVIVEPNCVGVHRRFELALQAKHELVYVQDDDVTLNIRRLWRMSGDFTRLSYACSADFKRMYDALDPRVCLIGWGAFFPRELADPRRWKSYTEKHGPVPSHEADRVFTFFATPQPHNWVEMPYRVLRRDQAMSRDNPDHYTSRDRIIKQLKELRG